MTKQFDAVILGQGLAGTALAWAFRWAGSRVLVLDREAAVTSSKVAAGLVTPITGQKLALTWRHSELWPTACSFYRRVEAETGQPLFCERSMVRLFVSSDESTAFQSRRASAEFDRIVREPSSLTDDSWFHVPYGGFEMTAAGQLDVVRYLTLSREKFQADGGYLNADVDVSRDIELLEGGVLLPRFDVSARWFISCQGVDALDNPWFRDVRFKPAKGEILTLRIPGLGENRVVHHGIWLLPCGGDLFKAGATYDWDHLDLLPTKEGRDQIVDQLRSFLRLPFEILNHQAAVRPIHFNQFPVAGVHPSFPQLAFFNGLGSKGTLQAPYFAQHLVAVLIRGEEIDSDIDLLRKTHWSSESADSPQSSPPGNLSFHVKRPDRRPLTERAQEAVRRVLKPGETAIDATAGNGYDTHFLAELVGPTGEVFAIDLQSAAIHATSRRLAATGLRNVRCHQQDHSHMSDLVPTECRSRVGAIMFNLGYLPGGDKQITTNPQTTREAIRQSLGLLRPGGVMTILAYTGHDGGAAEAAAVEQTLHELLDDEFDLKIIESVPGKGPGPRLFVVTHLEVADERFDSR